MSNNFKLEPWAEDAINQIDAGIFSSDAFFSRAAVLRLRGYMVRWEYRLKEIETTIINPIDE